ncbi:ketopantoate reductase family protein [Microbacterium sulfonylureivorans]|uniref:ketopantoate reductase family protein n=1 Tax=Microbacterium sulfonylureivorans TaxID=2486854 RepID=UPI000FD9FCDD|nr:2-dehydropantoate 2-reductase N-terminal domain-containing protein [Microbacterium sulfonylureivorans]
MRILVFGAGVLGSLYAARLHEAGHDVTLFARGNRLAVLTADGVQLERASTGVKETVRVPVIGVVGAETPYDLVLVFVRGDQLAEAARHLAEHRASGSLLFMVNNPAGYQPLSRTVGAGRLMLGFAGAGGYREGDTVKYVVLPRLLQPTTIGEPGGSETPRIRAARAALRSAGFPVAVERNMDAWYKYHAAWVTPVAYAIYSARASGSSLAERPDLVRELVDAARELWRALQDRGHRLTPTRLLLVRFLPRWILVPVVRRLLRTRLAETAAIRHAVTAPQEMGLLAEQISDVTRAARSPTPTWCRLFRAGEATRLALVIDAAV